MTEELKKTSVADLIRTWIDMMRANTQHVIDRNASKWHSSLGYNNSIENLELVIAEKLDITLLEAKVMLTYKKKAKDAKESKLFKSRKRKASELKTQKYLNKLTQGMGTIQTEIFHAHHPVCKLDTIVNEDDEETECGPM